MNGDSTNTSPPGRRSPWSAARLLRLLFDFVVPAAAGAALALAAWHFQISRCRGDLSSDPEGHFFSALSLFRTLSLEITFEAPYPPLAYVWTCLFFGLFGVSRQVAELSIAVLYVPLALAIYHTGKEFGGRAAGMLGLFLIGLNIAVFESSHQYMLELPMLLLLFLSLWSLLRSRLCQERRYCVLLGIFTGLGFLIRYNFFYACFPLLLLWVLLLRRSTRSVLPVLVTLMIGGGVLLLSGAGAVQGMVKGVAFPIQLYWLASLVPVGLYLGLVRLPGTVPGARLIRDPQSYGQLCNLTLAGTISLAISLPWYLYQLGPLWSYWYDMNLKAEAQQDGPAIFLAQLSQLWIGTAALTILGLVLIPIFKDRVAERVLIAAGGLFTFLLVAFTMEPQRRFLEPVLPFVMLTSTWWLGRLGRAAWPIAGLIIALHCVGFLPPPALPSALQNAAMISQVQLPGRNAAEETALRERCATSKRASGLARLIRDSGARQVTVLFRDSGSWDRYTMMELLPGLNTQMLIYKLNDRRATVLDLIIGPGEQMKLWRRNANTFRLRESRVTALPLALGGLVLAPSSSAQEGRELASILARRQGSELKFVSFFKIHRGRGFTIHQVKGGESGKERPRQKP